MPSEQLGEMKQQIATLAEELANQAKLAVQLGNKLAETRGEIAKLTAKSLVDISVIGALCITHSNPKAALQAFQTVWQSARGPLGQDGVKDDARAAAQERVNQIATSLGGKVI